MRGAWKKMQASVVAEYLRDLQARIVGRVESLDARLTEPMAFLRLNAKALVGMSAASATMPDQERVTVTERIAEESLPALEPYIQSGTLVFPLFGTVIVAEG